MTFVKIFTREAIFLNCNFLLSSRRQVLEFHSFIAFGRTQCVRKKTLVKLLKPRGHLYNRNQNLSQTLSKIWNPTASKKNSEYPAWNNFHMQDSQLIKIKLLRQKTQNLWPQLFLLRSSQLGEVWRKSFWFSTRNLKISSCFLKITAFYLRIYNRGNFISPTPSDISLIIRIVTTVF